MTDHPETLGKYEVRRILGEGGMGVVYEAFDPQIQRRVAIKAIRAALLPGASADPDATTAREPEDEQLRSRFQREAQAAGRMGHPRIVTVFEYGEDVRQAPNGRQVCTPFIVMELVEGRELQRFLAAKERFPLPRTQEIMDQLLDALGFLHRNGVVHRDIKPGNIMVRPDGSIKVTDFGIARIESSTLTVTGAVFGSPHYMAPEQLLGEPVDGRTDVYAAGVVLYELLTGERPFSGDSFQVVTVKTLKEVPLPPSELSMSTPKAYDAIIARALAKRPDERYQSAEEFRQALRAVASPQAGEPDATTLRQAPVAATGRGGARSVLLPGIAAAALVLLMLGTWFTLRRPSAINGFVAGPVLSSGADASGSRPTLSKQSPTGAQSDTGTPPSSVQASSSTLPPGVATVTAVGWVPAAAGTAPELAAKIHQDAQQRLIAKATALYVDPVSLRQNYALLRDKLFSRGGDFIRTVLTEEPPQRGAGGVLYASLRANLDLRAVRRLLNEVSEKDRVQLVRNAASPRVAVVIRTQDADAGAQSAQRSEVAENLLKERISSYGFVPVEEAGRADFRVEGTAALRRLALKLPASGLTIEKFVLTYWTIKATDRSGDQIYFNTRIPRKESWASRELALQSIGALVGDELSKGLFLENFDYPPSHVVLRIDGLPPEQARALLPGLQSSLLVLDAVSSGSEGGSPLFALDLAGGARALPELIQAAVIAPLNQQLQRSCLSMAQMGETGAHLKFDPACMDGLRQLPLDGSWGSQDSRPAALPGAQARQAQRGHRA